MLSDGCDDYPPCLFLGSAGDLDYWRRAYPELVTEVVGYCNASGCSMCVVAVPERRVCIARRYVLY